MRTLYVTTIGGTMNFFKDYIKTLINEGHTVDIATNEETSAVPDCYREWGCKVYHIDTSRSPLNSDNLRAIKQITALVSKEKYDIVHCHTPVAAMCTRLACRRARKTGTKVFYTAHGFHFYKGAPLKNWLMYYPVEKFCAHFTDVLITINREDYALAQKKMKAKRVEYVPGVGIDLTKFGQVAVDKSSKRKELGIPEDATLLLSVGELNENKNHETVIRAIKDLDVYYIIAGKGDLQSHLQSVIDELALNGRVKLLGFRSDIGELCFATDIFVFPSIREGLGLAAIEAMACGLPLVVADNRGTRDFCVNGKNGFVCEPNSVDEFTVAIRNIVSNKQLGAEFGSLNKDKAKKYDVNQINKRMLQIYNSK